MRDFASCKTVHQTAVLGCSALWRCQFYRRSLNTTSWVYPTMSAAREASFWTSKTSRRRSERLEWAPEWSGSKLSLKMVFVPLRLVHTTLRICCNLRHKVAFLQGDRKLLYLQCCSPLRQWQQPATSVNKPLGSCTYLCTFKWICLFDHIRFDIPTKILRIHHQQQQQHHHHQLHQQLYNNIITINCINNCTNRQYFYRQISCLPDRQKRFSEFQSCWQKQRERKLRSRIWNWEKEAEHVGQCDQMLELKVTQFSNSCP